MAPMVTDVAASVGFEAATEAAQISSLVDGGNPLSGLIVWLGRMEWVGIAILAVVAIAFAYLIKTRVTSKREFADATAETN